jgi:putative PEP-CTERM system TPR-repeat lipoprotein
LGDTPSAGSGDAYTVEFLLATDALRNKQPAKALELAKKLQSRYPDKVDPINLGAAAYLVMGQWDKAKPALEKALKLNPNDPSATSNLAKIEAAKGNLKRARELLLSLVKAQPGDEDAVLLLADIETRLGNAAASTPLLQQFIQLNPKALAARARLALEHLRTGKFQKVTELTQGLSDDQFKQHPSLLESRGKAMMQMGDVISARKTFEQWAKLAPGSATAHYYFGDSLARTGNTSAARQELEKALKLNPRYLPARIGEIKMLVQTKQFDAAKKALAKLKQDFGDRAEVLGLEGWFALGIGNYPEAEKALSAVLIKNPDTELAVLLVRAQWGQKKYDAAFTGMHDWLKSQPSDLSMLLHMAGAYLSLNRNEDARATYAQVVKHYPDHVAALNNLAWLGQDKDLNQSIKHALHAQTVAPRDPYVKDTLGMLMLKRGDTSGALALLREAAELAPSNGQFQLHLAQLLVKQQRKPEAHKVLLAFLNKAPQAPQAKEAKSLLDSLGIVKH